MLIAASLSFPVISTAQRHGGDLPTFDNVGPGGMMTTGPDAMAMFDYAQMNLDEQTRQAKNKEKRDQERRELVESGLVSALDLGAPNSAIQQYNRAVTLLKLQKSKEADQYLQKAIAAYPRFVGAHICLGLAYLDQDDMDRARAEFETAAQLDDKFPGSFLNLGRMSLAKGDFSSAQSYFEKAASLRPKDPAILLSLAYAQDQNGQFQQTLDTVDRVHSLDHKGLANVHYIAAVAAMSLKDPERIERELNFLLMEDPSNALAPSARKNLAILAHNKEVRAASTAAAHPAAATSSPPRLQTFPNNDRLKAELSSVADDAEDRSCDECGKAAETEVTENGHRSGSDIVARSPGRTGQLWTFRKDVHEVALFFAVSSHGHMVNNLDRSDVHVLDDNKPPEQVLEFAPQSQLPLRLALLLDTSGSVRDRFSFEKQAATKFVRKMLVSSSDLAFVAGFSTATTVTQDFTADQNALASGIGQLANQGGTALFDAVLSACWKLADYPDEDRAARVLVVLSDGEENSSHTSLKQVIQAEERTGVTVYAISTREDLGDKTDADKLLEVLAERSGGQALFPHDAPSLSAAFEKLRESIRSRYFIAYKPADFRPDGSYRSIRVAARKNGQRLQVRARDGYHAPLQTPD
jgi:VWFA-related protein